MSEVHTIPARHIDFGAVVRLPDGRIGWMWKGRGRDPYRVTTAHAVVSVKGDEGLEVVRWPAQLAGQWISDNEQSAADYAIPATQPSPLPTY